MKTKSRLAFRQLTANLTGKSHSVYLKLLYRLFQIHRGHAFVEPLISSLRERKFDRLYALADSLSEQKYPDATTHFVANQLALLIKKYPWPAEMLDLDPEGRATRTFLSAEKRVGLINRKFSFLTLHRSRDRYRGEASAARSWIRSTIGSRPNYKHVFESGDFGSGASIGTHGNATHLLRKLSVEAWTVTPGALHHGFGVVLNNFHYLEQFLPRGGVHYSYYSLDYVKAFEAYVSRTHVVRNNKISFVPKTAKTLRAIAVEPLVNGLVQKGIDQVLRKKLLGVDLDLSDQSRNQRMARDGSLDDSENGFVTIDLKSASDSISIELCRYLLPYEWFSLLDRTRSHDFELNGRVTRYNKFCSMGNGFCFPLETLIFASACVACGAGVPGVDFSVYGDDIIVRKRYATQVLNLLGHWGFKANPDKTFLEGPFRESCGADWFGGKDVRPYTLDHALDSVENVFKFLNLTRRSERTEMFFSDVRGEVVRLLPVEFQFFRPYPGQENTGIDSTGDEHLTCLNCHFSQRSGRWTWKELSFPPVFDYESIERHRDKPWLIGIALRGTLSVPHGKLAGLPGVTYRMQKRTKVVRKGYSSTSNWLPTPKWL